jgi:hypothetical protein
VLFSLPLFGLRLTGDFVNLVRGVVFDNAEADREDAEAEAELTESGVCRPFRTGIREFFRSCRLESGGAVGDVSMSVRGLRSGMLGIACG